MIYTKTYKKQAMERLLKLDDELGKVESCVVDLSILTNDSVKGIKGDNDIDKLLSNMAMAVSDIYTYKNKLAEEIEKANEE